ncbi:hypothetical protein [Nonomuraea fuscirosea]|uniref:hypothetical protein n=1 Tax=Nonomuraea fuscirosea TaxID=1291556 RepID=UPI00342B4D84
MSAPTPPTAPDASRRPTRSILRLVSAGPSCSWTLPRPSSATGQGAGRPAFQALTAEVVETERRQRANAAITLAVRVTTLGAPAATALLATVLDAWMLLIGTGLLWLLAAVLQTGGTVAFFKEFGEGVREARRHPWFLAGLSSPDFLAASPPPGHGRDRAELNRTSSPGAIARGPSIRRHTTRGRTSRTSRSIAACPPPRHSTIDLTHI